MKRLLPLLALCMLAGCDRRDAGSEIAMPTPMAKKLRIVATIAPLYCFAKNIAGDLADIELLAPPGISVAAYEPSAGQRQRILAADVVIENGFGFEPWMDRIVAAGLPASAMRVIASRGAGPGIPGLPDDPNSPPAPASADPGLPPDPHVWLDPLMAIREVQNIRNALMRRDPAHADDYLARENHYEASLRDLDDEIGQITVNIPHRRLYCVGDAFTYFLSRYEFAPVKRLDEASAILIPPGDMTPPRSDLPLVRVDPLETGEPSADFYHKGMRANAQALAAGLSKP